MKIVSVILTTYNGENVIVNTIKSILQQDGLDELFGLELIVVDDCSSDRTVEIAKSLGATIFNTEKNTGGPNTGRNIGLRHASGDYICIVDQDDVWSDARIKSVLPYLEKVPIVTSGYTLIDRSTNKKIERVNKSGLESIYYRKNDTFMSKLTKSHSGQNTYLGSIIYSSALKEILFEELFGVVDYDWVLRLFHEKESIEVPGSLYTRYVDGQNLSLDEDYRKMDFYYSLFFIENYSNLYPKEVKKAYLRIHGSRARYYYLKGDMKKARFYFLRAECGIKTILYLITSFAGSKWVKRKFNVFG
jgi:glycosyltransferase involved in cell wall biosynthesis